MSMDEKMPRSVLMVLDERARQVVEEGYDHEHDAEHVGEELAMASACYATPNSARVMSVDYHSQKPVPSQWPWPLDHWKPTPEDRLRELAKAGALIIAEIDRLLLEEVPDA